MTTDPVCGMQLRSESQHRTVYAGDQYYFCSQHCLEKFRANSAKYTRTVVTAAAASVQTAPAIHASGGYTCPMHPEVVRNAPGNCPICGMALEPRLATIEDNAELHDMTRRFWVSVALALPVFIIAMVTDRD